MLAERKSSMESGARKVDFIQRCVPPQAVTSSIHPHRALRETKAKKQKEYFYRAQDLRFCRGVFEDTVGGRGPLAVGKQEANGACYFALAFHCLIDIRLSSRLPVTVVGLAAISPSPFRCFLETSTLSFEPQPQVRQTRPARSSLLLL